MTGNGLGGLSDAISCKVTHEVNGIYEMSMQYPVTGLHFSDILNNRFIMATPDFMTAAQPFRIYRITRPLNGVVTIYARHITYDMSGIIIKPFTALDLTSAMTAVNNSAIPGMGGFTVTTTRTVSSQMKIVEPRTLWKLLGGEQGSFLDVYGGEWDFDGMTATLVTKLGTDRGVEIRYAKNLTKLEADSDLSSTYGGVFPYWYSEDEGYVAPSSAVMITGSPYSRILLLDCSETFETKPTVVQLQTKAQSYITANSVGSPKESWKVNFAMLSQSPEYSGTLDSVMLGDTVKVIYDDLGVNATARIVKTEWDALKEKYITATVGRVKQNLASIIVGQNREVESQLKTQKSDLENAIDNATNFIKNGGGYMRFIYDSNDNLTEIISMDDPDIAQATKVWRWNNGGFGFSSTGYNGTYGLAITQNGEIVADYITTGTLNAQRIKAGILQDTANKNSWNLATGAFTITDGSINIATSSQTYDAIQLSFGTFYAKMCPQYFEMGYGGNATINLNGYIGDIQAQGLTLGSAANGSGAFSMIDPNGVSTISMTPVSAVQGLYMYQTDGTTYKAIYGGSSVRFYDSNGTKTATYPADPSTLFTDNNLRVRDLTNCASEYYTTTGSATYTLASGNYLITIVRVNNTSTAYDAVYLAQVHATNSHVVPLLTPTSGSNSASINGTTLTVSRSTQYTRVTITQLGG